MNKLLRLAKSIAANGLIILDEVEDNIANARLEVCIGNFNKKPCEHFIPHNDEKNQGQCAGCGCLIPEKCKSKTNRTAKRPMGEVTHCPYGKWADKELANYYRGLDGLDLLT